MAGLSKISSPIKSQNDIKSSKTSSNNVERETHFSSIFQPCICVANKVIKVHVHYWFNNIIHSTVLLSVSQSLNCIQYTVSYSKIIHVHHGQSEVCVLSEYGAVWFPPQWASIYTSCDQKAAKSVEAFCISFLNCWSFKISNWYFKGIYVWYI